MTVRSLAGDRILVEASLWSADQARLAEEMERVDPFVDMYHVDVSDDHFVPGLLLFPDLVAAVRPLTRRPIHVHLMTERLSGLIDLFVEAGADLLTVHAECGALVPDALAQIRQRNAAAGVAIRLDSPVEALDPYLGLVDVVLLMGTPVGVKGVELAPAAGDRVRAVKAAIGSRGLAKGPGIVADGGIRRHTVPGLCDAGADILVMGSLLFESEDPAATAAWARSLRQEKR